ncbi:hypothetical protein BH11PSE14_BH11PSE14_02870 [soil metagenome]
MYYRIKNTLAGLAVATAILGLSWSIGHPPTQVSHDSVLDGADIGASSIEAGLDGIDSLRDTHKRNLGMRSQLTMPYFSFAPLLPRREG